MVEVGKIKLSRLKAAVSHSRRRLEPYRVRRVAALREYVGRNYSDQGAPDRVPVNFIELAINIYSRQLASSRPAVTIYTRQKQLQIFAKEFEYAVNHLLKELDFETTLRTATVDALFSVGIVKTGVCEPQNAIRGFLLRAGQPFAETISLDDWVHDMNAQRMDECAFMGNRFRIPLKAVKESDLYINTDKVVAVKRSRTNESGDPKAFSFSSESVYEADETYEYAELWELWLPQEQKIVTMAADETGQPHTLIREVDYDGPTEGPYHFLSYSDVPGNTMPLPPVATLIDMHELSNTLFRKLGRQAERQKDIVGFRGSAEADAKALQNAADGEMIRMDDPDAMKTYKFGGIDQSTLGFMLQTKNLFTYLGGNLDALGGLAAQSDTVGQDKLLTQSASNRVSDMQARTVAFVKEVATAVAQYLFDDRMVKLELEKSVGKSGEYKVPFIYDGSKKEGEFVNYAVDVQPHSLQQSTPGMKLQALTQVMRGFIQPLLPNMQQQGLAVDARRLVDLLGEYTQLPELASLIVDAKGQPTPTQAEQAKQAGSAPFKQTENVRVNKPGATQQGQDQMMSRLLLTGKGVQDSEAASILRPSE